MGLQDLDRETLEKLLRKVVAAELSRKAGDSFEKYMDPSGVGVVNQKNSIQEIQMTKCT